MVNNIQSIEPSIRISLTRRELRLIRIALLKNLKELSVLDPELYGDTYEKIQKALSTIRERTSL